MTREQEEDDLRFIRYLERENLASLMNNTKWRELIAAIQGVARYRPRFRVKCVREGEPAADSWDGSFPLHVPTFRHIEWLELDPIMRTRRGAIVPDLTEDFSTPIEVALAMAGVPFERVGSAIRIVGYFRPAKI